jgi:hypothetical protein
MADFVWCAGKTNSARVSLTVRFILISHTTIHNLATHTHGIKICRRCINSMFFFFLNFNASAAHHLEEN